MRNLHYLLALTVPLSFNGVKADEEASVSKEIAPEPRFQKESSAVLFSYSLNNELHRVFSERPERYHEFSDSSKSAERLGGAIGVAVSDWFRESQLFLDFRNALGSTINVDLSPKSDNIVFKPDDDYLYTPGDLDFSPNRVKFKVGIGGDPYVGFSAFRNHLELRVGTEARLEIHDRLGEHFRMKAGVVVQPDLDLIGFAGLEYKGEKFLARAGFTWKYSQRGAFNSEKNDVRASVFFVKGF